VRPQIVSDILGHRDPSSLSAYVRVALKRLRVVALPVPR
jgi:site-specific recombinase XerD